MANMNLFAALPEIVLLVAACAILVADLFVPDERRNVTYGLSMAALVAVAAVLWLFLDNGVLMSFLVVDIRAGEGVEPYYSTDDIDEMIAIAADSM